MLNFADIFAPSCTLLYTVPCFILLTPFEYPGIDVA